MTFEKAVQRYGEALIFSGSRATNSSGHSCGGALCSSNTLTVRGCTFYGNTSYSAGGGGDCAVALPG